MILRSDYSEHRRALFSRITDRSLKPSFGDKTPETWSMAPGERVAGSEARCPSVREFYDGIFHSPIYAEHHRVCCNVGFHPRGDTHVNSSAAAVAAVASGNVSEDAPVSKFQAQYPADRFQLQLYANLLDVDEQHEARRDEIFTILDVGCGAGGGLCELQTLYPKAEVVGLDISIQALERSKEVWNHFTEQMPEFHEKKLRLYQHSCERMKGLLTHSVDVAVGVQSLQEVQNLGRAVNEIARVLKPGGLLFVADFIPPDVAADHLEHSLLSPISSAQNKTPLFEIVQEQLVSYEAAMGAKLSSGSTRELIHQFTPQEFHSELETFFFVEHSPLYELLRRDQMGYRLLCLRKTDECSTDEEEDIRHVTEWSYSAARHSEGQLQRDFGGDAGRAANGDVAVLAGETLHRGRQRVACVPVLLHVPSLRRLKDDVGGSHVLHVFTHGRNPKESAEHSHCFVLQVRPNTTLAAHRGWADLANHVLRVHFPLVVPTLPNGDPCCAMVVGGETTYHAEREFIVFDDSKLHYAFNHHPDETRLVLIVDFYRPDQLRGPCSWRPFRRAGRVHRDFRQADVARR
ncbi:S-adenosyl-L-methionine-dependent methyltransferase [Phytophthora cactorum]|nr:S-adenosyl-L-methionine-dependent methyltransferase [Phytophthora cactorum]